MDMGLRVKHACFWVARAVLGSPRLFTLWAGSKPRFPFILSLRLKGSGQVVMDRGDVAGAPGLLRWQLGREVWTSDSDTLV